MIRPETIGIVNAGMAPLTGVVDAVRFAGDRLRIIVRDAAATMLVIDAPNTIAVKVGDQIGLAIATKAVRLLPPEGR
jgi:putative spermidine/putrescine transport system ATP-binding protein